jgi:hypothetical protein
MINQDLVKYISFQLDKKMPWEEIKKPLLEKGWTDSALEENYQEILRSKLFGGEPAPEQKSKPVEEVAVAVEPKEETKSPFTFEEERETPIEAAPVAVFEPIKPQEGLAEYDPEMKDPAELERPKQTMVDPFAPSKEKPKKKGMLIPILLIVLVLLLIGGGVFAYFTYFNNTPEKIMDKTITNLSKVKSGEYYGSLNLNVNEITDEAVKSQLLPEDLSKLTANFTGFFDVNDPNDIKGSLLVDTNIAMVGQNATANFEVGMTGNALYGLVNSVYLPELPEMQRNIMSLLTSSWVKYDIPDTDGKKISTVISGKINSAIGEQSENDLAAAASIKLIGAEKIDGIDCYHGQLILNKEGMKSIIIKLFGNQQQDQVAFDSEYNGFFENDLSKADVQIWVSKADLMLRKIYVKSNVEVDGHPAVLDFSIGIKNQNKQVKFTIPEITKNWNDIMGSLGMAFVPDQITPNTLIEEQMKQLSIIANSFKQTKGTYVGFVSSVDGKKIVSDIAALGGNVAGVVTAKDSYCIATKLLDNAGYWCIDSKGNALISNNCTKKTYNCK